MAAFIVPSINLINKWIKPHPELKFDRGVIYCDVCDISLKQLKKYTVTKHVSSRNHLIMKTNDKSKTDFYFDLAMFLICCNIPWTKLDNFNFRLFFRNICVVNVRLWIFRVNLLSEKCI